MSYITVVPEHFESECITLNTNHDSELPRSEYRALKKMVEVGPGRGYNPNDKQTLSPLQPPNNLKHVRSTGKQTKSIK